jgi:hypothetical protein
MMLGEITDFGRVHTPCSDCDNGHCTMNCSPRDGANDKRTVTTTLNVAVFWPGESGYGVATGAENMVQAEALALDDERRGYGAGSSRIHIVRTTREVIEWEISPASAAKLAAEEAAREAKRKKPRKRGIANAVKE